MGSWVLDITVITATGVIIPSLRMPAGIYLSIHYAKTSVKALLHDNSVVWDETVNLTSVPHTGLTIELRAAFESVTMVGRGELIRKIETSSDFLVSHGDDPFDIPLPADADDRLQNVPVLTLKVSFRVVPTGTELSHAPLDTSSSLPDSTVRHSTRICTPQLIESEREIAGDTDDGHAHFAKYMTGHSDIYLKNALECFERVLLICPEGNDARAAALSNLAWARLTLFVHNPSEGVQSILPLFRENFELRSWDHPDNALSLFYLAHALNLLSEIKELDIDIWESAKLYFVFLHRSPVGSYMRHSVTSGHVLDDVIHKCNDLPILSSADDIIHRRVAFMLCPPGTDRRPRTLEMLSRTLCAHGGIDAIEESMYHRRELLSLHPVGHIDRYISLNRLIDSLSRRFGSSLKANLADLKEIIDLCNESLRLHAVRSNEGDVAMLLNSVGVTLVRFFERELRKNDINNAIAVLRFALGLCPYDEKRRHSLGYALLARRSKADLDEALYLWRQSSVLQGADNPEREALIGALKRAFFTRYRRDELRDELDSRVVVRQNRAFGRWFARLEARREN